MTVECYLNFNGNCAEALAFYSKIFEAEAKIMTYGDMPPDPNFPIADNMKDRVLHAAMEIDGCGMMFSDLPPGMEFVPGNNISISLSGSDPKKLTRWFNGLSEGGKIEMPLEKTFWSELYGSVIDRFGIGWQVNMK